MHKRFKFFRRYFLDIIILISIFFISLLLFCLRNYNFIFSIISLILPLATWYANGVIRRISEKKLSQDFCGCWEVELHFLQTAKTEYIGLRVYFLVQLYILNGKIIGKSTKDKQFNPKSDDEHAKFKDQHQTSGKLDLVVDRDIVTVYWIEEGIKRKTLMTHVLQIQPGKEILSGSFSWEAASAKGEAIWQRSGN